MILYHGSFLEIAKPDLVHSRPKVDFGRGFYVTPLYDKVFNTVELFFDGLIDKTEAINRLRYEKPNLQICFRTEKALSLLHFEGSETL